MFKHQARYLVKRRDPQLWAHVLDDNNMYRKSLIEQVLFLLLYYRNNVSQRNFNSCFIITIN